MGESMTALALPLQFSKYHNETWHVTTMNCSFARHVGNNLVWTKKVFFIQQFIQWVLCGSYNFEVILTDVTTMDWRCARHYFKNVEFKQNSYGSLYLHTFFVQQNIQWVLSGSNFFFTVFKREHSGTLQIIFKSFYKMY